MEMTVRAAPTTPDGLKHSFSVDRFTIHAERCLNSWYRDAGCRRCADACPVTAIQLSEANIQLDKSVCVACGVCIRACPTEVFAETSSPEVELVKNMCRDKATVMELACPLAVEKLASGKTAVSSQIPQSSCHVAPRCLGAFSPAHLLELSQMGKRAVWLNDSLCAGCPIGRVQAQLLATVRGANGWLANYNIGPSLYTYTADLAGKMDEPLRKRVAEPPKQNARRSFFRKLLGMDTTTRATAHHLPQERARLLALLGRMAAPPDMFDASDLPVTQVAVDGERCSACGLCAKFCATGAIRFLTDEEVFGLLFTAGACVDCGICGLACPETAVSYHHQLSSEALLAKRPLRLVAGLLQPCPDCGAFIAQSSTHTKCFICRQQQSRPAFLMTR